MLQGIFLCLIFSVSKSRGVQVESDYGVDVSFPIHRYLTDKSSIFYQRYQKTMAGCYEAYSKRECDSTERARMEMNIEQPGNQHNYTELGFKKTRVPDEIFKDILTFYEEHKNEEKLENWPRGNTYVNNWESPSYMISFEDRVSFIHHLFYSPLHESSMITNLVCRCRWQLFFALISDSFSTAIIVRNYIFQLNRSLFVVDLI